MGGQFGVNELLQVMDVLVGSGKALKDLLNKSPLLALEDVWSVMAVVKAGVDLKEASKELLELDGDDKKAVLDHLALKLPDLQLPALEAAINSGAALLLRIDAWVVEGVALGKDAVALVGGN